MPRGVFEPGVFEKCNPLESEFLMQMFTGGIGCGHTAVYRPYSLCFNPSDIKAFFVKLFFGRLEIDVELKV